MRSRMASTGKFPRTNFAILRKNISVLLVSIIIFKKIKIKMTGKVRYFWMGHQMPPSDHYPHGGGVCSNLEQDQYFFHPNASQQFFACKYGPLKVMDY